MYDMYCTHVNHVCIDPFQNPFLCSHCGKVFTHQSSRDRHEETHMEHRPRPYKCSYCEKSYYTTQQHQLHERTHTGETPFQCQECGKRFTARKYLTRHMINHTGETPYGCQNCGMRFKFFSSMKTHKNHCRVFQNPPETEPTTNYNA